MRLSSTRSAFFSPNSRAISRVPTLPGCARTNARIVSGDGKFCSRDFGTYPLALPGFLLGAGFAGLVGDVLALAVTGARALLMASDLGLPAAFLAAAVLAGFFSAASPLAASFFAAGFFAARFGLPPPLAARSSIS